MTGKLAMASFRGKNADTQSHMSMSSSVRTVDREKLRDKARLLQMKDNMRLALCARIQQSLRKSPNVAEELASEVMRLQHTRGLGVELSDEQLSAIVTELSARRQEQKQLAASSRGDDSVNQQQPPLAMMAGKNSGRHVSSSGKDRSARSHGNGNANGSGRHAKSSSKQRGVSATSATDELEENVYLTQSQLQQLSTGFRLPPRVSPQKEKSNGIWEEIVKFGPVEEQQEAQRKRREREQARTIMSITLEQQVQQRRQQNEHERQAASQFYAQSMARLAQEDEAERQKEIRKLQQAQQLTKIQEEQRTAKQQQQQRESAIKKTQEARLADVLRRQNEEEAARDQARRDAEKRRILRVQQENEQDLQRKQQTKDQERALEMKLAADYIAMEEAKEQARKQQLEQMATNIQKKMKFFGDTAKADMDARAKEEEERVLKYQHEYDALQREQLRKKQEAAEQRNLTQQQFLKIQMMEKKEREDARKRDLNKQAELWKQERLEAERREKLTKQQRAMRNQSQQQVLKQQMEEKQNRSLAADQTSLEVQLNAKLLEKIRTQTGQGASVVSETQHRSRELQQREQEFLTTRQQRS